MYSGRQMCKILISLTILTSWKCHFKEVYLLHKRANLMSTAKGSTDGEIKTYLKMRMFKIN